MLIVQILLAERLPEEERKPIHREEDEDHGPHQGSHTPDRRSNHLQELAEELNADGLNQASQSYQPYDPEDVEVEA